jgi:hypothetical protein
MGPRIAARLMIGRCSLIPHGQDWQNVGCTAGPFYLRDKASGAEARSMYPDREALTAVSHLFHWIVRRRRSDPQSLSLAESSTLARFQQG